MPCLSFILVVVAAAAFFANCSRVVSTEREMSQHPAGNEISSGPCSPDEKTSAGEEAKEVRTEKFKGVSFTYRVALSSQVKAEIAPAVALESATDKPDSVTPQHIMFTFVGPYATQHSSSFFSPQIHIYPIEEYQKVLAASPDDVRSLQHLIRTLKTSVVERPDSWKDEIPFLPYGIDAHQEFHAHVKYVDFLDGKGIMFLTQYNIEPSLINNQGLIYTFQGITNDGRYYVAATFPVKAPFLPENYDIASTDDYKLPTNFSGKHRDRLEKAYQSYLIKTVSQLEKLSADDFTPRLTMFEELIRSLCIAAE